MTMEKKRALGLGLLAVLAVPALWARLAGFGRWPLALDEFYIAESVRNLLARGVPEFACGGYYARGVLLQYLTAPFVAGFGAEFGVRAVPLLSNLLAVPAVYLLGRRLGGRSLGSAATLFFLWSMWEIEFARFGRMYAPFQTLALWFAWFLMRGLLDGDRRARFVALALAGLSPLVWEGGIFLLASYGALLLWYGTRASPVPELGGAMGLAALAFAFTTANLRGIGDPATLPPDWDRQGSEGILVGAGLSPETWQVLVVGVVLAGAAWLVWSVGRKGGLDRRGWVALAVAVGGAALHQPQVSALALVAVALTPECCERKRRLRVLGFASLAVLGLATAWGGILAAEHLAGDPGAGIRELLEAGVEPQIRFPDVLDGFLRPWLRVMKWWTLLSLASWALGLVLVVADGSPERLRAFRFLSLLAAGWLGCVTAVSTSYQTTRYTFFLAPLLLLLALSGVDAASRRWIPEGRRRHAVVWVLWLAMGVASEDIRVGRALDVDSYETNFRVDAPRALVNHYYDRRDYRSAAQYVNERAGPEDLVVVTAAPFGDYLDRVTFIYRDRNDPEFVNVSCERGETERWTNLPMVYEEEAVVERIDSAESPVWLILHRQARRWWEWERSLFNRYGEFLIYTTPDRAFDVLRIPPAATPTESGD